MKFWFFVLLVVATVFSIRCEPATKLRADGITDTYTLINQALLLPGNSGSVVEVPDCKHTDFGPHITQVFDEELNRPVFAFHSHIRQDDDRCINTDRQRVEIKSYDKSPVELLGYNGEYVTYSWNFKLDSGFLPPYSFCHIHQLKAVGGDDSMPVITITLRKSTPNALQLLQYDSKGSLLFLIEEPLSKFLGIWVHAEAELTYSHNGAYNITLTNLANSEVLLQYSSDSIDFWRNETSFIRPKWGVYRSVQEAVLGRDEIVLFDDFCIGKGEEDRCFGRSVPTETSTGTPTGTAATAVPTEAPGSASILSFNKFILLAIIAFLILNKII